MTKVIFYTNIFYWFSYAILLFFSQFSYDGSQQYDLIFNQHKTIGSSYLQLIATVNYSNYLIRLNLKIDDLINFDKINMTDLSFEKKTKYKIL